MKAVESHPKQFRQVARRAQGSASPLYTLQKEHDLILKHSRYLVERLRSSKNHKRPAPKKDIALRFATLTRLLETHQKNEERILRPVMSQYLDTEISQIMSEEHAEFSSFLKKLGARLSEFNGQKRIQELAKAVVQFDSKIRAHFSKEENVIYWYASLCPTRKRSFELK